jgi:serine/threonine protein phosphatase PrpC
LSWPLPRDAQLVEVTALTHRGAIRQRNQDALVIGALTAADIDLIDPVRVTLPLRAPVVAAVADGLGGHAAGEVAAALTVRRLAAGAQLHTDADAVARLLREVNDDLYRLAAEDPARAGMGATVAGLVLTAQETLWFNVGDARAYREDGGYLGQVSVDDSPSRPAGAAEAGTASTVVTQSLGGAPARTAVDPHVGCHSGTAPDRWLLCSDGLSDLVPIATMERLLREHDDLDGVRELWAAAMNAGGRDNISIALVRRTPPGPATDR